MPRTVEQHPESSERMEVTRLRIKAIPGAKRGGIAGLIGDRLKVKVNAPPEDGKANRAICRLIASKLGVKPTQVTVEAGASGHEKTLRLEGVSVVEATTRLGLG